MRKIVLPALILLYYAAHSQNVGIGTGSPAAKLDITSTNSGVLIPRVALTATNSASPVISPAVSTLVYNTATAGSGATAVVPGYYYWNGSAWVQLIDNSSLTLSTTVGNTSNANNLSTTVNGVTGATVPMVNSINNTSSANALSTTVNGVTGSTVPIINSNVLSQNGSDQLISTINGVGSTPYAVGIAGDVTGNLGASTVVNIQGTPVTLSSLSDGNILQYSGSGTDWVNVTPASILDAATTNTFSLSTNTLTSTVNGIAATSNAVSGVSNTSSANTLSTTVNGVAGSTVPMVNSISNTSSANTLSTTVNGVAGSTVPIINSNALSLSTNTLTSTVNGIAASSNAVSGVGNASIGNTLSTTVNGVAGSTVPIINSNTLSLSTNTLTSTVNGQAATSSVVSGVGSSWTQSAGLTTTVNGVTGNIAPASGTITNVLGYNSSGAPVYQSISGLGESVSNTISSNTISTTVDATTGSPVTIPNIYTADGSLAGSRTVTMGADNLTFSSSTGNLIFNPSSTGSVGIGTSSPAAALDITSTTSGFLPPRLASAPATPAQAMVYYNTSTNCLMMYNGTNWQSVSCCSPGIIVQPASSSTICTGNGVASFVVTATGAGLTYQWQEYISSWNSITNGGVYSGATSVTLTLTNPTSAMNGRQYRCVVSGTCSPSVTSNAATLTVHSSSVPITITNSQTTATGANYQQMLTINSSAYAAYESAGLQNVEFSTGPEGTGTVLQAWIESGATNTSTSTVYWVNLGSNTIAASGGTLTIYMDFMPTTVMSASGPTGLAPQLYGGSYYSSSYGQFDNGAYVFTNYWNFAGTSSTGWTTCGPVTPTFNNGVTLHNAAGSQGAVYSSTTISSGIVIDALTSSAGGGAVTAGGYNSICFTQDIQEGPRWGLGTTASSGCDITAWDATSYTNPPAANTNYVITGYYISGGSALLVNYASIGCTATTTFSGSTNIALESYYATSNVYVQWLRTRTYPPGATMPGASLGTVGCY